MIVFIYSPFCNMNPLNNKRIGKYAFKKAIVEPYMYQIQIAIDTKKPPTLYLYQICL
jgi:hypothetical protein